MSLDQALRTMIRDEIASQLRPMQELVTLLEPLRKLAAGFTPYAAGLSPRPRGRVGRPPSSEPARPCAIVGCTRPSRSKGYCAAHYQKLRNLIRTGRRPAQWKDNASPASVDDVVLPRGRAAAKALKAARRKKRA
jgi:hypothetical protein